MFLRLNDEAARRLRARLAEMGFCESSVGEAIDGLVREGGDDLSAIVDAIFVAEGFENADLADRRMWRSIRDIVLAAAHESAGR